MNFITKTLNKLFKSSNQQELNKIKPIVVKINELEKDFLNFSEEKFTEKNKKFAGGAKNKQKNFFCF